MEEKSSPILPPPLFHHSVIPLQQKSDGSPQTLFHPVNHPVFNPKYTLDEEQMKKITELYSKLTASNSLVEENNHDNSGGTTTANNWTFDQWQYIHDGGCMARYLRARDWDVAKAESLLRSTLEWRNTFKITEISPLDDAISLEGETGKTYRNGFDLLGRPIIYMKPRFQNTKNYDKQVRYTVHHLERAMESMNQFEGVEQMVLFIDFHGYSITNAPPMSVTKEVLGILLNCYPERLGLALMIDAPFLFNMAYKVIYPFLPTETRKKIHFISGNKEEKRTAISAFIHPSVLESEYGGDNHCHFDHESYKKKEAHDMKTYAEHHSSHPHPHNAHYKRKFHSN